MPEWIAIWVLVTVVLSVVGGLIALYLDGADEMLMAFLGILQAGLGFLLITIIVVMAVESLG